VHTISFFFEIYRLLYSGKCQFLSHNWHFNYLKLNQWIQLTETQRLTIILYSFQIFSRNIQRKEKIFIAKKTSVRKSNLCRWSRCISLRLIKLKPWITPGILKSISKRNFFHQKYIKANILKIGLDFMLPLNPYADKVNLTVLPVTSHSSLTLKCIKSGLVFGM